MKVVITGANGQLGYELQQSKPNNVEIIAVDVDQLDITQLENVRRFLANEQPDWIINGAAYTAVDKAESEAELAEAVNTTGAKNLAQVCNELSIRMIQISTDFVFDGQHYKPYTLDDKPGAASVYGSTKNLGDQAVQEQLSDQAIIIRTSWLYSAHGNNFVKTMLRLMQEKEQLSVVYDQIGTPTWAHTLAQCCWSFILSDQHHSGIYHCSDNGVASWYDFAIAIQQEAINIGLLESAIPVYPIPGSQYPTPAARPHYSVMDKTKTEKTLGIHFPHWQNSLRNMLHTLQHTNT